MAKKNSKAATMQYGTPFGGDLNTMPMDYAINPTPVFDESKWGPLAYVSEDTRKKIMDTGFGEMQLHLDHIKSRVGQVKKLKNNAIRDQMALDFK